MERFLLVCVGGAIGTGLRYLTAVAAVRYFGPELPYGTLIVNLVGSFVIGFVQQMSLDTLFVPEDARLFITTQAPSVSSSTDSEREADPMKTR